MARWRVPATAILTAGLLAACSASNPASSSTISKSPSSNAAALGDVITIRQLAAMRNGPPTYMTSEAWQTQTLADPYKQ